MKASKYFQHVSLLVILVISFVFFGQSLCRPPVLHNRSADKLKQKQFLVKTKKNSSSRCSRIRIFSLILESISSSQKRCGVVVDAHAF
ncbi:MAG: hypothetical protein AMR96_03585 [Candidatus Adiutrix intracellularis]|nr:MAG: hypothetical protein AMR96_03585 [Candidatus Adiutrix intracellularis]MDR2827537.1 hypothetical protein [Candidatus Adiutrix intracellularis]